MKLGDKMRIVFLLNNCMVQKAVPYASSSSENECTPESQAQIRIHLSHYILIVFPFTNERFFIPFFPLYWVIFIENLVAISCFTPTKNRITWNTAEVGMNKCRKLKIKRKFTIKNEQTRNVKSIIRTNCSVAAIASLNDLEKISSTKAYADFVIFSLPGIQLTIITW